MTLLASFKKGRKHCHRETIWSTNKDQRGATEVISSLFTKISTNALWLVQTVQTMFTGLTISLNITIWSFMANKYLQLKRKETPTTRINDNQDSETLRSPLYNLYRELEEKRWVFYTVYKENNWDDLHCITHLNRAFKPKIMARYSAALHVAVPNASRNLQTNSMSNL